jgi:hypothetical protein
LNNEKGRANSRLFYIDKNNLRIRSPFYLSHLAILKILFYSMKSFGGYDEI